MKVSYSIICLLFMVQSYSVLVMAEGEGDSGDYLKNLLQQVLPEGTYKLIRRTFMDYLPSMIARVINFVCNYIPGSLYSLPEEDPMGLRFYSPCINRRVPLKDALDIFKSPYFKSDKKLAIFIHGWRSSSDADFVYKMADAFNCREDYNFLALDTSNALQHFMYPASANNTEAVGRYLAKALQKIMKYIPPEDIYVIGFSLGAHIAGYTGQYFTEFTGLKISRITGLDPAYPCFSSGMETYGLKHSHAEFVDVIHTNSGILGKSNPMGRVDFYPGGMDPLKPGCFSIECSHGRAYEYFIESVYRKNEDNFMAKSCKILNSNSRICDGSETPMGFSVPRSAKGIYYLEVNEEKPYGKNNKGQDVKCKLTKENCNKDVSFVKIMALDYFTMSTKALFELGESFTSSDMTEFCAYTSNIPTLNVSYEPHEKLMNLELYTPYKKLRFPLTHAGLITKSPYFSHKNKVAILITGWLANTEEDYVSDMADAFNCRGDYNFLVLRASDSIDNLHKWNNYNFERVGYSLASAIRELLYYYPDLHIRLIGHGLGAHIAGSAGDYFYKKHGIKIMHITGLDPSILCFVEKNQTYGLQRGQAEFIDVIHTNPGVFGNPNALGDVDFYVEGFNQSQPGCEMFGCSHIRAYEYFTESTFPGKESSFLAAKCSNLSRHRENCNGRLDSMGFSASHDLTGVYFLSVNAEKPYGKHSNNEPVQCIC